MHVLALALCALAAPADDVASWLAKLQAPEATERGRAQCWLAAHLVPGDFAALATALRGGDSEVRGRVVEALSAEDRHVGLAIRLASSADADVARAGKAALLESIERWSPGSDRAGLRDDDLVRELGSKDEPGRPIAIDADLALGPLEEVIDLLARFAPGAPELVVDPDVPATARADAATAIEAPFGRALGRIAAQRGLRAEGFGFGDGVKLGAVRWIRLYAGDRRDGAAPAQNAAERIRAWCLCAASPPRAGISRAACARALAATTWPAGIAWLAERWRADGDLDLLEGVALAARRGFVAPALFTSEAQAALRTRIAADLARGDEPALRRALACAQALGATGTCGSAGIDLCTSAVQSTESLAGRALWLRLVELELRRASAPAVLAALDRWIGSEELAPGVRLQALRARRACGPDAMQGGSVAAVRALIEWAASRGELDVAVNLLRGHADWPPSVWREPAALPAAWGADLRAAVLDGWIARADVAVAGAHLARLAATSDPVEREQLSRGLAAFVRAGDAALLESVFARAESESGANAARLDRLAALSGAAAGDERAARALASLPEVALEREDLQALGALAAGPEGKRARARLIASIAAAGRLEDRLDALGRAVAGLRAVRDEDLEHAFVRDARNAVRESDPALRARLRADVWPPPPPFEPIRLSTLSRSFARAGL